ncbi:unnamed protein product [Paramecium sonneborni]|uniref:C2H2-type domain-containing protein n=1 Tax=Paramecium sonneborni TaxID=65129 RepID=A0A8S1QWT0_9CILI|nr:unnamed protein product [Paramecium sonneborni]
MSESESEKQDHQIDYYKEAVKLYYYNCILYNHLEKVMTERNDLKTKVLKYELLGGELAQLDDDEIMNQLEDRKKKSRRSAADIDRHFFCSFTNCKKAYGTEASLIQHQRLKHGQNSGMDAYFRI